MIKLEEILGVDRFIGPAVLGLGKDWLTTLPGQFAFSILTSIAGTILWVSLEPTVGPRIRSMRESWLGRVKPLGSFLPIYGCLAIAAVAVFLQPNLRNLTFAASGVSIAVTLLAARSLLKRVNSKDESENSTQLASPVFLAAFLPLSLCTYGISCLVGFRALSGEKDDALTALATERANRKTPIALILPIQDHKTFPSNYGIRQIGGLMRLLECGDDVAENFDFTPIDHHGEYDYRVVDRIQALMLKGYKHFVVTESRVSAPLSRDWMQLYQEVQDKVPDPNTHPILVCTSASSPKVRTTKDSVYRFYIRSQEEARVLAGHISGQRNALIVAIDDASRPGTQGDRAPGYGTGAAEQFQIHWGGPIVDTIFLTPDLEPEEVNLRLSRAFSDAKRNKTEIQTVFVASYAAPLVKTIRAIDSAMTEGALDRSTEILITAPLGIQGSRDALQDTLSRMNWVSCAPKITDELLSESTRYHDDVEVAFVYFTLDRLTKAIQNMKDSPGRGFHHHWVKAVPRYLCVTEDSQNPADSLVELEIVKPTSPARLSDAPGATTKIGEEAAPDLSKEGDPRTIPDLSLRSELLPRSSSMRTAIPSETKGRP